MFIVGLEVVIGDQILQAYASTLTKMCNCGSRSILRLNVLFGAEGEGCVMPGNRVALYVCLLIFKVDSIQHSNVQQEQEVAHRLRERWYERKVQRSAGCESKNCVAFAYFEPPPLWHIQAMLGIPRAVMCMLSCKGIHTQVSCMLHEGSRLLLHYISISQPSIID